MNNEISVSVIVPVYNAARDIKRAIKSLTDQTLENIEIIVVDDASTDDSAQTIETLREKHRNLVYLTQAENQGVHNARLVGLQHARGEWIGFLDSDDIAHPVMFQAMHREGNQHQADIVVCGSYRVAESGKRLNPKIRFPENLTITSDVFRKFCSFKFGTGILWNKLYRREIILPFRELYFPWRQNISEDLLLNIGCFSRASTVYLMKDILHDYTYNQSSATSVISQSKAYVDTYRAYSIGISTFSDLGNASLEAITSMYRTELGCGTYHIDSLEDLSEYSQELEEATSLIYKYYPHGLALLASCSEQHLPIGKAVKQIIKRFMPQRLL